mmetsp:Transcript_6669/g.9678  ORF Transcript_6669/g.9678 Transcript_6669/m.9678 type:complete len:250 (+) Transcript_6669:90-839(+)|eukprot:CAMPEP_0172422318 /NCGR_PEP_ID=MMETSP1064-20121228/8483_1 /TAXON_ID=202472 /ORGANISM="Aulacoseira subarctica , Strain CCAP 1002/5" /LENGTH=249 /DNA_ID=CAMNT_0013163125 /DNA_START=66 /DNA_END=815 /DNA_ORIENTATION=+
MEEYDDEDLVFSGTNTTPLNAADAAKRLLEDTDGIEDGAKLSSSTLSTNSSVAVSTNKIAARLAQMRGSSGSNPSTLSSYSKQQPSRQHSADIDFGYKAPLITTDPTSYADHPTTTRAKNTTSFGVSSSSFAPVTLPPPATMSASSYMFLPVEEEQPRRNLNSSAMDIEEDIMDSSATPFLSNRDMDTSSLGKVQQTALYVCTRLQSMASDLLDKASSLDAQDWKKMAVQASIAIVGFIVLKWLFQKIF